MTHEKTNSISENTPKTTEKSHKNGIKRNKNQTTQFMINPFWKFENSSECSPYNLCVAYWCLRYAIRNIVRCIISLLFKLTGLLLCEFKISHILLAPNNKAYETLLGV